MKNRLTLLYKNLRFLVLLLFGVLASAAAQKKLFPIITHTAKATIVYDKTAPKLDSIAAHLLAADIEGVTSIKPVVTTNLASVQGNVIIIGAVQSPLVQQFLHPDSKVSKQLAGQWECFGLYIINNPQAGISKALIIAGSDARGTAYGVFSLSEKIGVSPWYWWADVPAKKQAELTLAQEDFISKTPSVKFRGIFINDEDWGLQPWAAKTFEPETGDIGPKTYAKVFELLLRLKANLIWPAMHPSTKAFFYYPGNVKAAEDYQIVVGSSHAEPMLRNNVDEWKEKTMGHFNYLTNKDSVYKYWEDRVKESSGINAIYSLGMRGVHDGQMEGVKNLQEAVPIVERIIADERGLLSKYVNPDPTRVPQVLTPYKEVLEIYDNGLKVPDDVTLVWPDDNYGYIQRLNTDTEKKRSGGAGVYYHASYWGRPHDYLWLPSTNPALMQEEMMKAYANGANRLWVLNVGDIKPAEYGLQFFLSMAYDATPFPYAGSEKNYMTTWANTIFGKEQGSSIAKILDEYYQLAFERRPEFMGWSQTEPTTQTTFTSYNHFSYGDEAQRRLDRYAALEKEVKTLRKKGSAKDVDAFYQLVYYPIVSAAWMNQKFLYRDKAFLYAKQNRMAAYDYAAQSAAAYDSIVRETAYYNEQLSGGKWKHIMSMDPRKLPVYLPPVLPLITIAEATGWDAVPEGYDTLAYQNKTARQLPVFTAGFHQSYFIDVFLTDSIQVDWQVKTTANWITVSLQKGMLLPQQQHTSCRFWVSVNWAKAPVSEKLEDSIVIEANGEKKAIGLTALRPAAPGFSSYKGFAEQNGLVSLFAAHYSGNKGNGHSQWQQMPGLVHTGMAMQSVIQGKIDSAAMLQQSTRLSYQFYSFSGSAPTLTVFTLPTHPLNTNFSVRYAVSVDDGPLKIVDGKTLGRSEEWKQNVLRNTAIREIDLPPLKPGVHTLNLYAIDPGVVVDRMLIRFGKVPPSYSVVPETRKD